MERIEKELERPETQRQLQQKQAQQVMNGNFSIPIPKNPDEELGCKFDTFKVSISVMLVIFIGAVGLLLYLLLATVDNHGSGSGGEGRSIPGKIFSFIH